MLRENARKIGDDRESSRKRVADFTATILHVGKLQTNVYSANSWIPSYRIFDEKFARYFQCKRYRDIRTLEKFYLNSLPKWVGRWIERTSLRMQRIAKCTALVNFFKSWLRSRVPCNLSDSYLKSFCLIYYVIRVASNDTSRLAISNESSSTWLNLEKEIIQFDDL